MMRVWREIAFFLSNLSAIAVQAWAAFSQEEITRMRLWSIFMTRKERVLFEVRSHSEVELLIVLGISVLRGSDVGLLVTPETRSQQPI